MSQSGPSGFRKFFSKKVDEDKVEEEILSMVEEGHEQGLIEEGEMEPFVCDVEGFAAGKTDAPEERRHPIFVTLSLRVECSPPRSHSILVLRPQI